MECVNRISLCNILQHTQVCWDGLVSVWGHWRRSAMAEQGSGRRRWTCKGKGNLPIITQSMQWEKMYSGKLSREKTFTNHNFCRENFHRLLACSAKGCHAPKFCFANNQKSSKFEKVSHEWYVIAYHFCNCSGHHSLNCQLEVWYQQASFYNSVKCHFYSILC